MVRRNLLAVTCCFLVFFACTTDHPSSEEDDISSAPMGSPACREREGLDLAKLTVDELRKLGADMELSVGNCRKRSDLVDAIRASLPNMSSSSSYAASKEYLTCEGDNICKCCKIHHTACSSNGINAANGPVMSELLSIMQKLSSDLAAITDSLVDNRSLQNEVVKLREEISEIRTRTVIKPRAHSRSGTLVADTYASTVTQIPRTTVLSARMPSVPAPDPARNQTSPIAVHVTSPEHTSESSAHPSPENTEEMRHSTVPPHAIVEQSQSDESWTLVNNRRKRGPAHKPSDGLKGTAPMKRAVFYVGNIDLECTADVLVDHCVKGGVKVATCRIFPSRKAFGTASARISIDEKCTEKLLSDGFFPEVIRVRPWVFEAQSTT